MPGLPHCTSVRAANRGQSPLQGESSSPGATSLGHGQEWIKALGSPRQPLDRQPHPPVVQDLGRHFTFLSRLLGFEAVFEHRNFDRREKIGGRGYDQQCAPHPDHPCLRRLFSSLSLPSTAHRTSYPTFISRFAAASGARFRFRRCRLSLDFILKGMCNLVLISLLRVTDVTVSSAPSKHAELHQPVRSSQCLCCKVSDAAHHSRSPWSMHRRCELRRFQPLTTEASATDGVRLECLLSVIFSSPRQPQTKATGPFPVILVG